MKTNNPSWWNDQHDSAWDRVKAVFRGDWEQEKSNDRWEDVESDYRYGVGARSQYGTEHRDWSDRLEVKLKEEWQDLKSGRTWDEAKRAVRRVWERKD